MHVSLSFFESSVFYLYQFRIYFIVLPCIILAYGLKLYSVSLETCTRLYLSNKIFVFHDLKLNSKNEWYYSISIRVFLSTFFLLYKNRNILSIDNTSLYTANCSLDLFWKKTGVICFKLASQELVVLCKI